MSTLSPVLDTHACQQEALFHLSANLVATLNEDDICQKVVESLHRILGYGQAAIFLLDEATNERVLKAHTHPSGLIPGMRLKPGQGLSERPLLDGCPHYTPDVTQEPNYVPGLNGRSELDIPLKVGERILGVLVIESQPVDAFGEADFAVLTATANQVAVALERAREHQAVKEAEIRYQSLFDRVPIALYRTTPAGEMVEVNLAMVEMLGYPDRESLLAINAIELYVNPEDRHRWQELLARQNLVRDFKVQMRCFDGRMIWIRNHSRAIRDEHGQMLYLEGSLEDITHHNQIEEEIRHLKEFNEGIIQQMAEGITVEDEAGFFTFVNPAAATLLGYNSPAELIGQHWHSIVAPDQYSFVQVVNKRRAQGEADRYEIELVRKDGVPVPVLVSGSPRFEQNVFVGTLAVFTDISERVKAEKEIHQRNRDLALLNRVIAASVANLEPQVILETVCRELALTFDFPIVFVALLTNDNTTVEVIADYNVSGKPAAKFPIPIENVPAAQYVLAHKTHIVVENAQNDSRMAPVRDLLRYYNVASLLGLPFIIEEEIVGFLAIQTNEPHHFLPEEIELIQRVADQISGVLARLQLEKERRRLSAAIEQTVESMIITDTDGTIVYVNPAFEHVSGYNRLEAIGQNANILKSGRHDEAFYRELWKTISTGRVWQGRMVNQTREGKFYTDETTITPIRNEGGEIVNYISVQRDVTHELELEEQLRRSQKMEAVGELTAGIAHDFNNLLTAINGFAELLLHRMEPDTPAYEMAGKILRSGQQAADLVSQLLAFGRKQIIRPQVLNLNTVVRNVQEMLQRVIGEAIELDTILAPDLWSVEVDPAQMEQVIINLAINARDAMPEGGKLIIETTNVVLDQDYVTDHLGSQPGEHVMLSVTDTGHGMSREIQARIFEPFFTTKDVHEGTGLGLAMVFGIIKQSKGNIWVYSEEGLGATFKIYLPRAAESAHTLRQPIQLADLPRGTETILLVEDDTMVRELAARVLREQGYTILEATHGREALEVAQDHSGKIHLLLTDMVMPQMGGRALSDQIQERCPGIKILLTSGYSGTAMIRQGITSPDMVFIQKPFLPADIIRKVRQVLDGEMAEGKP
ncbi:MAG: PAS domain S-box protein [Anaerolineae bacterium]|nr:PAS domain S-box protein [Anaerolineae bacterium]